MRTPSHGRAPVHGGRRHAPRPRPVTYGFDVVLLASWTWNVGPWREYRESYGEAEAPISCVVFVAITTPENPRHLDQGVVAVMHVDAGDFRDAGAGLEIVDEIVNSCAAMMDEKLGAAHWRPGDVLFYSDVRKAA